MTGAALALWRHREAMEAPVGAEIPIALLWRGIVEYARRHERRFESPIGEDYVLGPHWLDMCRAFRGLLDGETGRLDCGTLSTELRILVERAGMSLD